MATIDVYNMKREKVGSVELADEVFGTEVKEHLFYEVVKAQLASRRQGTAGGEEALRRLRQHQEALQAEGHGPRASRLDPRADVRRRRSWPTRRARVTGATARRSRCASARSGARSRCSHKEGRLVVVDRLELAEIKTKGLVAALGTLQKIRRTDEEERARRRQRGNEKLRALASGTARTTSSCRRRGSTSTTSSGTTRSSSRRTPRRRSRRAASTSTASSNGEEERQCSPSKSSAGPSSSPRSATGSARAEPGRLRGRPRREQDPDQRRRREALQGQGRRREHARHARQRPAHGARLRQDAELEEGDRHPQRGRRDRLLRRERARAEPWESSPYKPTSPARRFYSVSDFKEITKGAEPEKSAARAPDAHRRP